MYYLEKEFWISCSHRLNNDLLSKEDNLNIFGKCNNDPSHGHNYQVVLKLKSEYVDLKSGMIVNFYDIKNIFNKYIDDVFDHKFLNDCKEFKCVVPTAENMCKVFYDILKKHISELYAVKIYETQGACAEYAE